MKKKLFRNFAISIVLSLISCSCDQSSSSSAGNSAFSANSSEITCKGETTNPDFLQAFERLGGLNIYCWRNKCGNYRFRPSEFSLGEKDKPDFGWVDYAQTIASCSSNEMAAIIAKLNNIDKGSYSVFEIPNDLDETAFAKIKEYPYRYICRDKGIYSNLGIEESYGAANNCGYFTDFAGLDLPEDASLTKGAVSELGGLLWNEFGIITIEDKIHFLRFAGNSISEHRVLDFMFFNPDKLVTLSGKGLLEVVSTLGSPSFVAEDSGDLCYLYGDKVWSIRLGCDGADWAVTEWDSNLIQRGIVNGNGAASLDDSLALAIKENLPLPDLIRKFGRPTEMAKTNLLKAAYRLSSGGYLWFDLYYYQCGFDYLERSAYVHAPTIVSDLPTWWLPFE